MIRWMALILFLCGPAWAVEPDEMLADPALEARARALSTELRCPVCQNESIDESSATLAKDLRIILRERLVAGDTDAEAVTYLVARYGEFILLKPDVRGANWLLWAAAPVMFFGALAIAWGVIRRRPFASAEKLTESEQARLNEILKN